MDDPTRAIRSKIKGIAAQATNAAHRALNPSGLEAYQRSVGQDASTRNPVVVIPGILGSRLEEIATGRKLWGGSNIAEFADPNNPVDLEHVAFPIRPDAPLRERTDTVHTTGTIEEFSARIAGLQLQVSAYGPILEMLGVGGFLREKDKRSPLVYDHRSVATCFEFAYDWRRSIPDNASRLKKFIEQVLEFSRYDAKLDDDRELKVDIVAHSMGGLLTRYFLRYGDQPLEESGDLPEINWAGSELIEHALLVGTPNAGSILAIVRLLEGLPKTAATPSYHQSVLATHPALYQLLPRNRHQAAVDASKGELIEDLYDAELWARNGWGLCSPGADVLLKAMVPDETEKTRREFAQRHVADCLNNAKRFHETLDVAARTPQGLTLTLFAGDGVQTPSRVSIEGSQTVRTIQNDLGDGTVLRSSALMDERRNRSNYPRVLTPIDWDSVNFIPASHMVLTRHPAFINNALYILLEKPKRGEIFDADAIDRIIRETPTASDPQHPEAEREQALAQEPKDGNAPETTQAPEPGAAS